MWTLYCDQLEYKWPVSNGFGFDQQLLLFWIRSEVSVWNRGSDFCFMALKSGTEAFWDQRWGHFCKMTKNKAAKSLTMILYSINGCIVNARRKPYQQFEVFEVVFISLAAFFIPLWLFCIRKFIQRFGQGVLGLHLADLFSNPSIMLRRQPPITLWLCWGGNQEPKPPFCPVWY